jgi:hypothetical protein
MSHSYHLRPNVKARMQRRLDTYVAAFGERNRDKIVAEPSKTGHGVHLRFDPERSLSPDPDHEADHQVAHSTEDVIVMDESDSGGSSSDLGSDLDTVAPDTPSVRTQFYPSSHLRAPKAPRHVKQEHWNEGSVDSSSVHDSLALIAERKRALKAHLNGNGEGRRLFFEYERQKLLEQAKNEEERIAILRRVYEGENEQFRKKNAEIFGFGAEDMSEYLDYSPPSSPELSGHAVLPPQSLQPPLPLRRHDSQFIEPPRDKALESVGPDGQFVVVARRVPKLGPCGTVVLDHETGKDKLVTRRYRVRAEELESIDGDGDSVMGSDD